MNNTLTYEQGMIDAINLWGQVCGQRADCENCVVNQVRGELSCFELAEKCPDKMIRALIDTINLPHTYYNEYCYRFPESKFSLQLIATIMCRKAIFQGDVSCDLDVKYHPEICQQCWETEYLSDIDIEDTQVDEEVNNEEVNEEVNEEDKDEVPEEQNSSNLVENQDIEENSEAINETAVENQPEANMLDIQSTESDKADKEIKEKQELKFCTNCGAILDGDSLFCTQCGIKL